MVRRLLRWLAIAAYGAVLVAVMGLASYVSFSRFVRAGAMPAPDLVGLSLSEAQDLLGRSGLVMRRLDAEDRYDDKIPTGHVVQQDPAAGRPLKQGGRVRIILSRGHQRLQLPDVTGQTVRAAQAALASAGSGIATVAQVFWPGGEPGTVVRQSPAAGTQVDPLAPVELLVSIEDPAATFVMPDLVYRRSDAVRRYFEARGFHFGSIKYEPYEGVQEGVILRHTPLAGHPLRRTDSITLVVATSADG